VTPTLYQLQAKFRQFYESGELRVRTNQGEEVPLKDRVESGCPCSACQEVLLILGKRPLETRQDEKIFVLNLLEFLGSAPPLVRENLVAQFVEEVKDGLIPWITVDENNKVQFADQSTEVNDQQKQKKEATMTMQMTQVSKNHARDGVVDAVAGAVQEAVQHVFKNPVIVHEGAKIIVPKEMSKRQAIQALEREAKADETEVGINIDIDAYPLEGARAFHAAVAEKFGWVDRVPIPGFWKSTPPEMIDIEVDVGQTEQVMWGRIEIPAIDGYLETGITVKDSRFLFCIEGEVKQKHKYLVEELAELTRKFLKEKSMYKGKALRITFPDPDDKANFNPMNSPKFVDTSKTRSEDLIFSENIQAQIEAFLFNPIEFTAECRAHNISLKRGTLLAGTYGVGKSMAAAVTAKKCVENNWTFLYVDNAEELPRALRFAKQYSPAVVFVEDVDKVLKGERNKSLDSILNTIDGIDTKNDDVMLVFTTNNLEVINKAALRAKRLDVVIEITPPDAAAVQRLIRLYTRGNLAQGEQLEEIGQLLDGQIPATIEEVCSRAQLASIRRAKQGERLVLKERDLLTAGQLMLKQLQLIKTESPPSFGNSVEKAAHIISKALKGESPNGSTRAVS